MQGKKPSRTTIFMFKSFTATCFGSCIRSHHKADTLLTKSYRAEHLLSFY